MHRGGQVSATLFLGGWQQVGVLFRSSITDCVVRVVLLRALNEIKSQNIWRSSQKLFFVATCSNPHHAANSTEWSGIETQHGNMSCVSIYLVTLQVGRPCEHSFQLWSYADRHLISDWWLKYVNVIMLTQTRLWRLKRLHRINLKWKNPH